MYISCKPTFLVAQNPIEIKCSNTVLLCLLNRNFLIIGVQIQLTLVQIQYKNSIKPLFQ